MRKLPPGMTFLSVGVGARVAMSVAPCLNLINGLEDSGGAHSSANTHCHHAVLCAAARHLAEQCCGQLGPGAAERMTERNRPAVDIELCRINAKHFDHSQGLCGESLV